jgi:hypothetical protein
MSQVSPSISNSFFSVRFARFVITFTQTVDFVRSLFFSLAMHHQMHRTKNRFSDADLSKVFMGSRQHFAF